MKDTIQTQIERLEEELIEAYMEDGNPMVRIKQPPSKVFKILKTSLESVWEDGAKAERKRIKKAFGEIYLPPINDKSFAAPIIEVKAVIMQTELTENMSLKELVQMIIKSVGKHT